MQLNSDQSNRRRWRDYLREQSVNTIVTLGVTVVLTALAAIVFAGSDDVFRWLGAPIQIDRWSLGLLISICLCLVPFVAFVGTRLRELRYGDPATATFRFEPENLDMAGLGPSSGSLFLRVTDERGRPVPRCRVDLLLSKDSIRRQDGSNVALRTDRYGELESSFVLSDVARPGDLDVMAIISRPHATAQVVSVRVGIVGKPAFVTLTPTPQPGIQNQTITLAALVTDSINQRVWDGCKVSFSTNAGELNQSIVQTQGGVAFAMLIPRASGNFAVVTTVENGITGAPLLRTDQIAVETDRVPVK